MNNFNDAALKLTITSKVTKGTGLVHEFTMERSGTGNDVKFVARIDDEVMNEISCMNNDECTMHLRDSFKSLVPEGFLDIIFNALNALKEGKSKNDLERIKGLKSTVSSVAGTHYNKAIDDVIEIITGERPAYPETRCMDCANCFIYDDSVYFCEARDDLGGEDGQIEMEQVTERYPCDSFSKRCLLDRNKLGNATCPECGKEGVFYLFNDVYHSDGMPGMNPTTCPSCDALIFKPKEKMEFEID